MTVTKYELPEKPPEWSTVRDKDGDVWVRIPEGMEHLFTDVDLIGTWGEFLQRVGPVEAIHGRSDSAEQPSDGWSSVETAQRVLDHLRSTADHGQSVAGIRELARELKIGRSTASRALRRLVETGRIEVLRPGTGDGYRTRYRILDPGPAV